MKELDPSKSRRAKNSLSAENSRDASNRRDANNGGKTPGAERMPTTVGPNNSRMSKTNSMNSNLKRYLAKTGTPTTKGTTTMIESQGTEGQQDLSKSKKHQQQQEC